ncbi:MAG: ABC transporter permease [Planctomycetales bacterium]
MLPQHSPPRPTRRKKQNHMAGGIARAMVIGTIVLLVSLFFVDTLSIYSIPITFAVALLTATLFSIAGFINAVLASKFDDIAIIPTFVLTPLTYLGGRLLPDQLAAAALGDHFAIQPDRLHGECFSIRYS